MRQVSFGPDTGDGTVIDLIHGVVGREDTMIRTFPIVSLASLLALGTPMASSAQPVATPVQWGQAYPRGDYQRVYDNGYRSGLREGERDARSGRRPDYRSQDEYRRGSNSNGWGLGNSNAGNADVFRRGFAEGYQAGYQRFRGSDGGYGSPAIPKAGTARRALMAIPAVATDTRVAGMPTPAARTGRPRPSVASRTATTTDAATRATTIATSPRARRSTARVTMATTAGTGRKTSTGTTIARRFSRDTTAATARPVTVEQSFGGETPMDMTGVGDRQMSGAHGLRASSSVQHITEVTTARGGAGGYTAAPFVLWTPGG